MSSRNDAEEGKDGIICETISRETGDTTVFSILLLILKQNTEKASEGETKTKEVRKMVESLEAGSSAESPLNLKMA